MNYNNCNGWNEYAGTYEGAYYAGDAAFARTAAAGGKLRKYCGRSRSRHCRVMRRNRPDLRFILAGAIWQGFYANNRCNQSAEARTAAQAADRTAAASNCRCSCNNCNNCGNWNNCGNCGNCRS